MKYFCVDVMNRPGLKKDDVTEGRTISLTFRIRERNIQPTEYILFLAHAHDIDLQVVVYISDTCT